MERPNGSALVFSPYRISVITPNWLKLKGQLHAISSILLEQSPDGGDLRRPTEPGVDSIYRHHPYDKWPLGNGFEVSTEFRERVHTLTIPRFLLARAQFQPVASEVAPLMVRTLPDYAVSMKNPAASRLEASPRPIGRALRSAFPREVVDVDRLLRDRCHRVFPGPAQKECLN